MLLRSRLRLKTAWGPTAELRARVKRARAGRRRADADRSARSRGNVLLALAVAALGAGAGGCDDTPILAGAGGAGGAGGASSACPDVSGAPLGVAEHPSEGANHVVVCSPVCYGTIPPSSGNHYPVWPVYQTYAEPVPWGFLVHGLEHGAVEVIYNCPAGCPDEVAAAQAWIDALPIDANCQMPPRVILAPDPTQDVRWAATAWTWTLRADAFDPVAFQAFFDAHYDHGPEVICGGVIDQSATGWCQ